MTTPTSSHYDSRAPTYDSASSFHQDLAAAYTTYITPLPGQSLLDLACGTGLVTFAFAPLLAPPPPDEVENQPVIIGIDISPGMLEIARAKLPSYTSSGKELNISFIEHDVSSLGGIKELKGLEGFFDIITICSALVLLDDPRKAMKEWVRFLKRGGRLIVDIPSNKSMVGLKILGDMARMFGVNVLGGRGWVEGEESLRGLLEEAGLEVERCWETGIWEGIPARTVKGGKEGKGFWRKEEGGDVFEEMLTGGGMEGWKRESVREKAKEEFARRWSELAGDDGLVREEGRLYVGIGRKV